MPRCFSSGSESMIRSSRASLSLNIPACTASQVSLLLAVKHGKFSSGGRYEWGLRQAVLSKLALRSLALGQAALAIAYPSHNARYFWISTGADPTTPVASPSCAPQQNSFTHFWSWKTEVSSFLTVLCFTSVLMFRLGVDTIQMRRT